MRTIRYALLCTFLVNAGACAFMKKENRPATTALDDIVAPESTGAKVALAPLIIPVGFATLVADVFALHPLSTIPTDLNDTYQIIWENPSGGVVQQSFLLIPKIICTPFVFVG
ncbi:MAG: hypothetical protein K8S54_20930, partial [Spirochaetia bacterium]|nr:hypothetical protein [Spirochaetia bacterium]